MVNRGQIQWIIYALPIWHLVSRLGLGPKYACTMLGVVWIELRDITWLWRKKWNLLIFNLFNGNAFLNIVILYYLLMRPDVWFENHLVLTLKWSRYWALPMVVNGVPMDPNSENAFPEWIFTKLGIYQDYSKTLILAKEKLKNNVRFRK